jgi:Flp pilus assembly protein TadG
LTLEVNKKPPMVMKSTLKIATKNNLERGQSLTELAISFPVILLLMIGTLDFGMAIYSYLVIRDAAQEGALYGSINPNNNTEIENRARFIAPQDNQGGIYFFPVELNNKDKVAINIKTSGNNCQGVTNGKINSITVNVSYDYPILIPFSETIIGRRTINLDATATNVILQPACK